MCQHKVRGISALLQGGKQIVLILFSVKSVDAQSWYKLYLLLKDIHLFSFPTYPASEL